MVDPLTTSAISWGFTAAGWLISPVLSRFLNKCIDELDIDLPPQFQSRKRTLDKKLEDLQTTLLPKLLILTDAAQQSSHRQYLEKWIQKLKSAYYEAEHLLGLVEYERLEEKVNNVFPSVTSTDYLLEQTNEKIQKLHPQKDHLLIKQLKNFKINIEDSRKRSAERDNLIKSIEKLVEIVNEGMEFVSMYNIPSSSVNNSNWRANKQYRETISTPDSTVIGRDKERDDILTLLEQDSPESVNPHSVIAIWGMGGLGKTTLAQYVCEHVKEKKCFEPVMWVHVSENFNIRSIMQKMLESVTRVSCQDYKNLDTLISQLRDNLEDKKFLLVLDDVWLKEEVSQQELNQLFAPLNCGSRGSKILVTTRNKDAARALGAENLNEIRELDHKEFLSLFTTRALSDVKVNKQTAERLREIGVKIAEKLSQQAKSPLAAITVAGQLRRRPDLDFWKSILNKRSLNDVMGALYLSYQNLHPALQRCFAFCSLFPKGHSFNPKDLVNLWIAEGFIETEDNDEHMKDIANRYFLELVSGSFFQVHKFESYTAYSMHDLIHDLAQRVSEGECFRIESGKKNEIPTHTRHLYVDDDMLGKYMEKICKIKDLRTIIGSFSRYSTTGEYFDIDALFINLRKLLVVQLEFIRSLPKSVIHLKNLRHLKIGVVDAISDSVFESLNRLYQLRVLQIRSHDISAQIEIPDVGRLILLQDLWEFHVKKKRGLELKQLEHLTELYGLLSIYGLHNVERKEEVRQVNLSEKKGLRELQFYWDKSEDDLRRESDVEILDGLCPPPQLKRLVIKGYSGKRFPNWILENNDNIIHLKHLTLDHCNGLEALSGVEKLSDLQSLHISNLPRLKSWVPPPVNLTQLGISGFLSLAFALKDDSETIKSEVSTNQKILKQLDGDKDEQALSTIANDLKGCLDKTAVGEFKDIYGDLYLPPTLEKLEIGSCIITDRVLAGSLQGLNSLTVLSLSRVMTITCITDEVLCSLTSLRYLNIEECLLLTSIGGWDTHGALENLEISSCPNLTLKASLVANSCNTVEQASSSCKRKTASCILKTVNLDKCSPLDDCFQNLVSTEELTVKNCSTIVAGILMTPLKNSRYTTAPTLP